MKKGVKIVLTVLLALVLLLLAAWLLVQTPGVQTFIVRKVADKLEENFNGRIEFSKIHFSPFNAIVVKDLSLIDDNPGRDPSGALLDTIASARTVVATFSLKGLLKDEGIHVKRLSVTDGSFTLTTEEGGIIGGDPAKLDTLYDAGVRMMTVTWNYDNELGHPNRLPAGVREDFRNFYRFVPESGRGLTSVGKEAVARMEELGIIPDVSHLSDDGFYDVADIVKGPFAASHSNARALCGCSRNLTDDMIRTVAEHGGVIGLNFCPSFVMEAEDESRCFTSCEALAAHARHIMNVGGREVIAFGTDFDGIPRRNLEIQNASMMQRPADYMLGHGFTMEEVEGMYYKNVLRLYREVL